MIRSSMPCTGMKEIADLQDGILKLFYAKEIEDRPHWNWGNRPELPHAWICLHAGAMRNGRGLRYQP